MLVDLLESTSIARALARKSESHCRIDQSTRLMSHSRVLLLL
jgi:hypothetical protein